MIGTRTVPRTRSSVPFAGSKTEHLSNATSAYNVVRNFGGSMGIAVSTTLLARRSQYHQNTLGAHVNVWSADTADKLRQWTEHFQSQGADSFTAGRQALAMLYRSTIEQAQILGYADDFWLISMIFIVILPLIPLMRRVRAEQNERAREGPGRVEALPAPND